MPLISVITIAKKEEDLIELRQCLSNQTFKDFEFVFSTKGTIPEAWNDAIIKAKGDYIIFTESDAQPLHDNWLEEISKFLEKNTILKGLEINPTHLNMCNLVCDAAILKKMGFNEKFKVAEDTEFFARLRKNGISIKQINSFPVIHTPSQSWKKTVTRSFLYGRLMIKILILHGKKNIDNVNNSYPKLKKTKSINPISNRVRIIMENFLFLLGLFVGIVIYFPFYFIKKER